MLHEDKQPDSRVNKRLLQSLQGGHLALIINGIALDSLSSKDTLFWCQPSRNRWIIRQEVCSADSNNECDHALEDEKPAPSRDSSNSTEAREDTCRDETCKCGGEDVTCVENGDSGCDFLACVEYREKVERTAEIC